jgi:hypothetical protein
MNCHVLKFVVDFLGLNFGGQFFSMSSTLPRGKLLAPRGELWPVGVNLTPR